MPDFGHKLRDFIIAQGQAGNWTETDPPWDKVHWAYAVTRDFLTNPARRGSNWLWIQERNTVSQPETERIVTSWKYVDVYIFASAVDNNEKHVQDARDRMYNMQKMITHLVTVNKTSFPPAWIARPDGGAPLPDSNLDPPFFVYRQVIKLQYEED